MRSGWICLWCCWFASPLVAREGMVETRDGHAYEGHIRFDSNLLVVADAAKELLAYVDLTNLAALTFKKEASEQNDAAVRAEEAWPWQDEDIGSVRLLGGATREGGLFHLTSSGTNIFGQGDAFHFVHKAVKGDSEMVARVLQVQYTAPWAKAGLMMRESLAADARNVFLALTPVRAGVFQWREGLGEVTNGELDRGMSAPNWLRLRREGNIFTASKSRDGRQWKPAGRVTIPMAEDIFVGMASAGVRKATTSRSPLPVNHSMIDNVREAPFLVNDFFTPVVQLQSGSVASGQILFADERQIHFAGAPPPASIPTSGAARILFRWLPERLAASIGSGRSGVLLTSGEFVEGDFKGIERGQVRISSVLLGVRTFDLNNDTIAVVLRRPLSGPRLYEVKTADGSVWVGAALHIEKNHIVLQERSLGAWRIPFHELLEVRRTVKAG